MQEHFSTMPPLQGMSIADRKGNHPASYCKIPWNKL